MRTVSRVLNLKQHTVRDMGGAHVDMVGPFDLEGHRGADGRLYFLDFARLFPPEPPAPGQCASMGRNLRPEFVRQHAVALSSDAFCPLEVNQRESAAEVRENSDHTIHNWRAK